MCNYLTVCGLCTGVNFTKIRVLSQVFSILGQPRFVFENGADRDGLLIAFDIRRSASKRKSGDAFLTRREVARYAPRNHVPKSRQPLQVPRVRTRFPGKPLYLLAPCSIVLVVLRTRSYRTLRAGSFVGGFPRHFVPDYDRCRPSGTRRQTFRNSILRKPVANCPGGTVRS